MRCHLTTRSELREQDDVSDVVLVGKQHDDAIDADAQAARRRRTVLERNEKVLIERLGLNVACLASAHLLLEASSLYAGIVQLGKGVGNLDPTREGFEAVHLVWIVRLTFGER